MRRVLVLAALVIGFAAATGGAGPKPSCGPLPATFDEDVTAAQKARDAAYAKALAARKLEPWRGDAVVRARKPGDKVGASLIALGTFGADAPPFVELVEDRHGTLFRVLRKPTGTHKTYTQCGCGGPGGGAAVRPGVDYVAEVPEGSYGGVVTIAYPDHVPVDTWSNNDHGRPCPMRP